MKEMVKSLVLVIMGSVLFASCDEQKKELKNLVKKMNSECPLPLGDFGSVNSVTFDSETVEMIFTINETFASISVLNNHQEEIKEITLMSLSKETSKDLVDKIIDAGANLRTVVFGGQSGMRAVFEVSSDELKSAKEKFSNMTDSQKLVAGSVLGTKFKLPLMISDFTKLVGLSLTADALIYKYEINDSGMGQNMDDDVSLLKNITLSQMALTINNDVLGKRNKRLYQALIDCNQGIECDYYEVQTAKRTTFRISTDEIKEVLDGKWDNMAQGINILDSISNANGVNSTSDVALIINQFLYAANTQNTVDYRLFEENSNLNTVGWTDSNPEYNDLSFYNYLYTGKLYINGRSLRSYVGHSFWRIILRGPHSGPLVMEIVSDDGAVDDQNLDGMIDEITRVVSASLIEEFSSDWYRAYLYQLNNGYILFHKKWGASTNFLTIFISSEKENLLSLISDYANE